MQTNIKCPNCGNVFDVEGVIANELEQQLKKEYEYKLQQSLRDVEMEKNKLIDEQRNFEERKKKENELFNQRLAQEKQKMGIELQEQLRRSITADFENQIRLLQENNKDNEERLKLARQKELDYLKKEQELKTKEEELEIEVQKKVLAERIPLAEQIRKEELERNALKEGQYQLKLRELEKQLDDQKKLAEEMKRKAEQGSMKLQGEAQELMIQDMLKESFPFDLIEDVGVGQRGADIMLTIRNRAGKECGKIYFESKRAQNWSNIWIEKLKKDMRSKGADVAVLVTQAFPRDMEQFGEREGIWICSIEELLGVTTLLRIGILRVSDVIKNQENKGDKMHMLYDYLTSNEFGEQWKAIREGFQAMRQSILTERDAMEKLWKSREKQLEKVLLNAAHIKGSIEGIAGQDSINLNLLEDGNQESGERSQQGKLWEGE